MLIRVTKGESQLIIDFYMSNAMYNYHMEIVYTDQLYGMMYAIALPPLARGAESVILWGWNVLSTSQRVWAFR